MRTGGPPRSRSRVRLGLLATGLGLAALVGELGLRAVGYEPRVFNPLHAFHEPDPEIGRRGRPRARGRFQQLDFDVVIEHDARGFRKHLHPPPPAEQEKGRVWVVGDSFVWGWGVNAGEPVSDQLAALLPEWQVRNLGLVGSGTARQYRLFEREAKDLRVGDEVLLLFFANDFVDDLSGRGSVHFDESGAVLESAEEGPKPFYKRVREALREHSVLFGFLSFQANRLRGLIAHARGRSPLPDPRTFVSDGPERNLVRTFLARFDERADQAGAHFSVVPVPGAAELGEDDDPSGDRLERERGLLRELRSLTDELAIEQIDVRPALRGAQTQEGPVFIPDDGHWNARGHAAVARALAKEIRERRSDLTQPLLLE